MSPRNWLKVMDRGGLTKCTNDFYEFLRTAEILYQQNVENDAESESVIHSATAARAILDTTSIREAWEALDVSCMIDSNVEDELKTMIVEYYVRIRTFGFTRKKMEKYKQEKKQHLQKSKSLRSKLLTSEP